VKVLIAGAGGQLGSSLVKTAVSGYQIRALTRAELDVTDTVAVTSAVTEFAPQVVVNAAAYTAVDKAEGERDFAFAANADGAENLAKAAQECSARFIHISTDFVFDGQKSSPYLPTDAPNPLGVYGASKAEGEERVQRVLGDAVVIIRSGWVYAAEGHNFVKTILRLLKEKDSLGVSADQVGTPTWAISLAQLLWRLVEKPEVRGIYHWSDAGVASWYDFAVAIQEEALAIGLLKQARPIHPIATEGYPLPAKRPAYSVLDKRSLVAATGIIPVHWRVSLRRMLMATGNT
jgi:dTDP-4-dehydrorhamnose reductase